MKALGEPELGFFKDVLEIRLVIDIMKVSKLIKSVLIYLLTGFAVVLSIGLLW